MKLKYCAVRWNEYAPSPANWKAETRIKVIDENTLEVDGECYEFSPDGFSDTLPKPGEPDTSIRAQTNGVICEAHRDNAGELFVTVRRFFGTPGGEIEWYSEDYVEVAPCK